MQERWEQAPSKNEAVLLISKGAAAPFLLSPSGPLSAPTAPGKNTPQTCVRPNVVFHRRSREEGVMAGRPGALKWLLPRVQLHVVVQRPLLREAPVTQVTCEFPGRAREEELKAGNMHKPSAEACF